MLLKWKCWNFVCPLLFCFKKYWTEILIKMSQKIYSIIPVHKIWHKCKALVAPQISGARSFPRSLLKKGAGSTLRSFQNKRNALIPRSSAKERPFLLPLLFLNQRTFHICTLTNVHIYSRPFMIYVTLNYISYASIFLKS